MSDSGSNSRGVSRRSFIQTVGLSAAAGAAVSAFESASAAARQPPEGVPTFGPEAQRVTLTVNRRRVNVEVEPGTTLLDALRWHLHLTGTKPACDRGSCGACSVLIDGALVTSCMMLALDAVGREITTIEGLALGDDLDGVQEAFIRHDALQCGFCTPGLVLASKALLEQNPKPTLDQIKHGLSGNICRCGTYNNVYNAVLDASGQAVPVERSVGFQPARKEAQP